MHKTFRMKVLLITCFVGSELFHIKFFMSSCAGDVNRLIYRFYIFLYLIDIFPKLYKHTIEKKLNFVQGLRGEHSSWQIDWSSQFLRTTNYPLGGNLWYIKVIKVEKLCTLCLKVNMKLIDTYIILFNIKSCSSILSSRSCCLLF